MSISGLANGSGLLGGTSANTADTARLSDNYQMFLTLLTTQLQNQSPLDPMNADQFTQQLVQYSSVEQQLKMNSNLEQIKNSMAIANATSLLNYVGTTVTADGSQTQLSGGKATWNFKVPEGATADIVVKNAAGEVVYSTKKAFTAGNQSFTWDGKTSDGTAAPDGTYTIAIQAKNAAGNNVDISLDVTGKVESLDFSEGQPFLVINGTKVSVWSVTSVKAAQ